MLDVPLPYDFRVHRENRVLTFRAQLEDDHAATRRTRRGVPSPGLAFGAGRPQLSADDP